MKHFFLAIITLIFGMKANSQPKEDNSKLLFYAAKDNLERLFDSNENVNYEDAIFIIENAWYGNKIDKASYDATMDIHITAINRIVEANYNESSIKQKPNLLHSKQQILNNYKKALTNWAIYTYMTSSILFEGENDIYYHKAYSYSKSDPMATNDWKNTQVVNLNNTGQGNCFALASMFKILSDRLNSGANLCTAPSHIYIRHADDKGMKFNVELASEAFPGTGMISAVTYTTNQAIENGISQRELNNKESIALCLVYLAKGFEHKFNNMTDEFILDCAEAAMKYDKKCLSAMLLKAEYLERKLLAKNKSIIQLKNEIDFIELQNILSSLYCLGYREMPNDMKVNIISSYQGKQVNAQLPNLQSDKRKFATLSWGLYDERHTKRPTETYGRTSFDTRSSKITKLVNDIKLIDYYTFDPVVFAWNIDPLAHKYPSIGPYAFVANNPTIFTDQTGAFIVGMDGKPVFMEKVKGKLQLSANASEDVKRVGKAMLVTKTGSQVLKQMLTTKHEITITIDNKTDKPDRYAETTPTYDEKKGELVKSDIVFFMKTIKVVVENPLQPSDGPQTTKQKENNFNEDDMLGVNGTHEGTHASNKKALQIQKDAKYGRYGDPSGAEAYKKTEEIPDALTNKDIDERIIEKKKTK